MPALRVESDCFDRRIVFCFSLIWRMQCSSTRMVFLGGFFRGNVAGSLALQNFLTGHLGQSGDLLEQNVCPSSMIAEL